VELQGSYYAERIQTIPSLFPTITDEQGLKPLTPKLTDEQGFQNLSPQIQ